MILKLELHWLTLTGSSVQVLDKIYIRLSVIMALKTIGQPITRTRIKLFAGIQAYMSIRT